MHAVPGGGRSLRCTVVLLRLNSTTRPDRTRADFFARPGPQTRVSDEVRGLCLVGSRRARVVEFSYYALLLLHITHLFLINHKSKLLLTKAILTKYKYSPSEGITPGNRALPTLPLCAQFKGVETQTAYNSTMR